MPALSIFDAQIFASLRRHRNYRLYFSGQLVSQIGTWLQNAAQAWLVLGITNSPEAVGVLSFFLYLPYAILGLIGGALADRWDRQRMIIITQTLMALCAAALAVVAYMHVDSITVIDAIAFVRGTVMAFNNPTRQAIMIQLVGRSELPNAIALNSSLNNATRIIGPAIAGVLISSVGVGLCFALNAVSFVAVIFALMIMRRDEFFPTGSNARTPLIKSIKDGLVYARRTKTVAVVLTMLFIISTVSINFQVILPVMAKNTLHGTAQTYGFIWSVFGLGAFVGAISAASRKRISRRLLLWAAAGFGLAQLVVATQSTVIGVSIALFVTGICYSIYTSSSNSIVQLAVPMHMQGRIAGLYNYVFLASGPLGSLLAGWLAERGAPLAFIAGGVAAVVMAFFGYTQRPWPMPTGTHRPRRRRRNQIASVTQRV